MARLFQRRKETFRCQNCNLLIRGNGYTNHCPQCLWSKHVDINPGDREEPCRGMMEPNSIELSHGTYVITHCCKRCGSKRRVRSVEDDNFDLLVELSIGV